MVIVFNINGNVKMLVGCIVNILVLVLFYLENCLLFVYLRYCICGFVKIWLMMFYFYWVVICINVLVS